MTLWAFCGLYIIIVTVLWLFVPLNHGYSQTFSQGPKPMVCGETEGRTDASRVGVREGGCRMEVGGVKHAMAWTAFLEVFWGFHSIMPSKLSP